MLNSDTPLRTGRLAVVVGITLLTAACSSGTSAPQVASLGSKTTPSAGSSAAAPSGNPTQLLDEWATCMRGHGDPGQTDPAIDSDKEIHITYPANLPQT